MLEMQKRVTGTKIISHMLTRYCTVLYCTVLYCTVLYCTVLHCTALYCTHSFSHGGEIFIHTLSSAAARSTLEDPPSISEVSTETMCLLCTDF